VTPFHAVIGLVLLQRGGELLLARANTARLLARGAVEIDRAGYKWFVVLHAAWLAALLVFVPAARPPSWLLLVIFFMLQTGRVWVIASLGRRWTTRLVVVPDEPLVGAGPYRWLNHPNYLIVFFETAILPLAFAAVAIAGVFCACNACLIARRIRLENAALGRTSHHIRETLPRRNSL
jgi:methyltransferase